MTMDGRSISYYAAIALLILGPALAALNWYLEPAGAAGWASALAMFGVMVLAFVYASHRSADDVAQRRAGDSIRIAIVFAGLILALALAGSLAGWPGGAEGHELFRRAAMAVVGAFFVFTGNALPKTLTPLASQRCDAGRVQAFQRFAGWTWVLTGVAFAGAWLILPLDIASPVSTAVMLAGMLLVAGRIVWSRRLRTSP